NGTCCTWVVVPTPRAPQSSGARMPGSPRKTPLSSTSPPIGGAVLDGLRRVLFLGPACRLGRGRAPPAALDPSLDVALTGPRDRPGARPDVLDARRAPARVGAVAHLHAPDAHIG